jgi:methylase of polypeptide subunit release factors
MSLLLAEAIVTDRMGVYLITTGRSAKGTEEIERDFRPAHETRADRVYPGAARVSWLNFEVNRSVLIPRPETDIWSRRRPSGWMHGAN